MDNGNKTIKDAISDVIAQLKADDGSFRAAIILRDKQRPYDPPTTLRVFSVQEIRDFVEGIPDQVHHLVMTFGEDSLGLKVSLTGRTGSYNLHYDAPPPAKAVSVMSKKFDEEIFRKMMSAFPESIALELNNFLTTAE
jgi:L-cysteine desulfidase